MDSRPLYNHVCANGIEMHVAQQFQQILIGVDEHRVVALLEKMSCRTQVTLNDAGILTRNAQHQAAERRITHLNEQMHMIGHQAVRMKPSRESFDDFRCEFGE